MRQFRSAMLPLFAVALIVLAAVSGAYGVRELNAARLDPGRGATALYFWGSQRPLITAGTRQQRRLLASCLSLISSPEFPFHAIEVRRHLAAACAGQARHAHSIGASVAEIPTLLAAERLEAGDLGSVDIFLFQSMAQAPMDLELILHRIRIGLRTHSPEYLARPGGILEADMPVLIGSARGVHTAAALYVQLPQIRPLLDRLADALPPVDRERFLGAVRRQLRG